MKYSICYKYPAIVCLLLLVAPLSLRAQQAFTLKGIIAQAKTNERVAKVKIINLKTQEVKESDNYGGFSISARLGDTLEFSKISYTSLKQVVASSNAMIIYLEPTLVLNPVVIKGSNTKQDQQAVFDAYRSKGVYNNGHSSFLSDLASPLNGLYDAFSKNAKEARHFQAYIKTENENRLVDQRFNKTLITKVTGLQGDDLASFITIYRPPYSDAVKWTDYDMINYIKTSFDAYNSSERLSAKNDLITPSP